MNHHQRLRSRLLLVLGLTTLSFLVPQLVSAEEHQILFVGNSYTYGNNLNEMTCTLLSSHPTLGQNVTCPRHALGGWRFIQHLAEADGTNGDTNLKNLFENETLLAVIFQEQSQIPGFPPDNPEYSESLTAFQGLNELTKDNGAHSIALMTWGRRSGDSSNAFRFPDFKTMQGHLRDGYYHYATKGSSPERSVVVAPAGLAFEFIFDQLTQQGEDPLIAESLFSQLYSGDGSHPAPPGTYLVACVLFATITGDTPVGLEWAPDGMDEITRQTLQEVAEAVVLGATIIEPHPPFSLVTSPPQEPEEPEDTTEETTPAAAEPEAITEPRQPDSSFGCSGVDGVSLWGMVGLWLGFRSRRRKR